MPGRPKRTSAVPDPGDLQVLVAARKAEMGAVELQVGGLKLQVGEPAPLPLKLGT